MVPVMPVLMGQCALRVVIVQSRVCGSDMVCTVTTCTDTTQRRRDGRRLRWCLWYWRWAMCAAGSDCTSRVWTRHDVCSCDLHRHRKQNETDADCGQGYEECPPGFFYKRLAFLSCGCGELGTVMSSSSARMLSTIRLSYTCLSVRG